jgi:hypothetical protein
MATIPTPEPHRALVDYLEAHQEAAGRIRELNERLINSAKAVGISTMEAYEKVLESLLDFEQKCAGATQLDWVSALAQTHAALLRDLTVAYSKAARELFS